MKVVKKCQSGQRILMNTLQDSVPQSYYYNIADPEDLQNIGIDTQHLYYDADGNPWYSNNKKQESFWVNDGDLSLLTENVKGPKKGIDSTFMYTAEDYPLLYASKSIRPNYSDNPALFKQLRQLWERGKRYAQLNDLKEALQYVKQIK